MAITATAELCPRCRCRPRPAAFKRCDVCRQTDRARAVKVRKARRTAGLCRDCRQPAELGRARCRDHLAAAVEYGAKHKAAHPKPPRVRAVNPVPPEDRCGSCRKREKRPGRATCVLCEERSKARRLKQRLDSDARLVCTKCSLVAVPGKKRCERHLDMQRKASAKIRERKRDDAT